MDIHDHIHHLRYNAINLILEQQLLDPLRHTESIKDLLVCSGRLVTSDLDGEISLNLLSFQLLPPKAQSVLGTHRQQWQF